MKLRKLVNGLDYEVLQGNLDVEVRDIKNDSRIVEAGDLFFCITGAVSDGHKYAKDVSDKGAGVLIVEKPVEVNNNVCVIKVQDTRYAMGVISSRFYGEPSKKLTVIGITGTKGKTTTTYMIREMLMAAGHKTGLIGTIEIIDGVKTIPAKNTTPESMALHKYLKNMVDNGLDSVVMEVSSQGLMLDRVAGVDFDYGIFSNLSQDHIGPNEHKTFEEYRDWKAKLFGMCKVSIINTDDKYSDIMIKNSTGRVVTFGKNSECDYAYSNCN